MCLAAIGYIVKYWSKQSKNMLLTGSKLHIEIIHFVPRQCHMKEVVHINSTISVSVQYHYAKNCARQTYLGETQRCFGTHVLLEVTNGPNSQNVTVVI